MGPANSLVVLKPSACVQEAPVVSPFETALQSAHSMESPEVANRLKSSPAGTMFQRPQINRR